MPRSRRTARHQRASSPASAAALAQRSSSFYWRPAGHQQTYRSWRSVFRVLFAVRAAAIFYSRVLLRPPAADSLPEKLRAMAVTAAVLAGGRGSRIGGDKALVQLGGRPLISYPLGRRREQPASTPWLSPNARHKLPALDVPRPARARRPSPSPPRRHHRAGKAPGRDRAPLRHAVRRRRGSGRARGAAGRTRDAVAEPAVPVSLSQPRFSRELRGGARSRRSMRSTQAHSHRAPAASSSTDAAAQCQYQHARGPRSGRGATQDVWLTRSAAARNSSIEAPARPATQQASGAAGRSEECAAVPASASSFSACSGVGGSTPSSRANAAIHSSLVTAQIRVTGRGRDPRVAQDDLPRRPRGHGGGRGAAGDPRRRRAARGDDAHPRAR